MNDPYAVLTALEPHGYRKVPCGLGWRIKVPVEANLVWLAPQALTHFLNERALTGAKIQHMWDTTCGVPDFTLEEGGKGVKATADLACFLGEGPDVDEAVNAVWLHCMHLEDPRQDYQEVQHE